MKNIFKINLKTIILSNFALLIFILNVPGTIGLRNLLAASLLLILISCWNEVKASLLTNIKNKNYIGNVIVLFILTIYILFHSIFIADEVSWSLSQYRTQWIYPMIYFIMGVSLASLTASKKYFKVEVLIAMLFYSLLMHILLIALLVLFNYFQTGTLLSRYGGLTQSPVLSSYISNILISMVIVEFIYRLRKKKRMIQLGSFWLSSVLFLCIFSSIIAGMRFGAISLFFMTLTAFILIIIDNKNFNNKAKGYISISVLILCTLPLIFSAVNDVRWHSLFETIPIAIDTENNTYWRDGDEPPKLSNGSEVSHSNYMRVAWAAKGLEYVRNDLFGIGYGRNVFGHAVEKYEKGVESLRGYHSHSGILDFTIGVGVIGLCFWLLFVGRIIISSAIVFISSGNYFSLLSLFITSGFVMRSIVDSNMRDHMFKQFFLILGIALTLAALKKQQKINDS